MLSIVVGLITAMLTVGHPVVDLSYDDAQLLMQTAQAEGGNQGADGMWLVMSVIINRVESDTFPDTVRGVVYQKGQFATAKNGAIESAEISNECHIALARIEKGEIAKNVIAFENKESSLLDKYFERAFEYKDHRFYTLKIK